MSPGGTLCRPDTCDSALRHSSSRPRQYARRPAPVARIRPAPACRRAAAGDDRGGVGDRRPSRRRPRRGRADGGAPLRLRHAARPADLGRRPPGLSAQDPDRPARPHPHAAPAGRAVAASPSAPRANTTRSAPRIPRPRSRPALGMAVARDLEGEDNENVIAVIGDGAMSAGMAYEAMNNAGHLKSRLIVILNDNDMSIAPPVGAMSALSRPARLGPHLSRLPPPRPSSSPTTLPRFFREKARLAEEFARSFWTGGTLFEELGFYYVGPIDGHNLDHLLPVLRNVARHAQRPGAHPRRHPEGQGLRAGRGGAPTSITASASSTSSPARRPRARSNAPAYTKVFAESLIKRGGEGRQDRRHHRGDAGRHRPRPLRRAASRSAPSTSASPSSTP